MCTTKKSCRALINATQVGEILRFFLLLLRGGVFFLHNSEEGLKAQQKAQGITKTH